MSRILSPRPKEWNVVIETIETHGQGFADTLALNADPELPALLKDGEKEIRSGRPISLDEMAGETAK